VGIMIMRFLLPTGRLSSASFRLCRASCNRLVTAIRHVVAGRSTGGPVSTDVRQGCHDLHTESRAAAQEQMRPQGQAQQTQEAASQSAAPSSQQDASTRRMQNILQDAVSSLSSLQQARDAESEDRKPSATVPSAPRNRSTWRARQ